MPDILHRPLGLAGLYLLVTAPTLLPGPWTTGHVVLVSFHLGVCLLCLRQARVPKDLGWLSSWIALILIPLFYAEIALLNQSFGVGYHDSLVLSWEAVLFGSPATELAGRYPYPLLSESLTRLTSPITQLSTFPHYYSFFPEDVRHFKQP